SLIFVLRLSVSAARIMQIAWLTVNLFLRKNHLIEFDWLKKH
ncbi:hypothetical protein OS145_12564, partial [Idiomarina baltica OS145]